MDHGLAAPFDLDSLRSKVESRFDSVERLSRGLYYYECLARFLFAVVRCEMNHAEMPATVHIIAVCYRRSE